MTSLVAAMTSDEYKGLVIIIAGYPRDIDEMLDRNAGLKSRFSRFIDFEDWQTADCLAFLRTKCEKEGYAVDEGGWRALTHGLDQLRALPGFGNGRDVAKLWRELQQRRAERVWKAPELTRTLQQGDVDAALERMLHGRRPPTTPKLTTTAGDGGGGSGLVQMDFGSQRRPQPQTETRFEEIVEPCTEPQSDVESDQEEETECDAAVRDAGVSDAVWDELCRAREAHEAHLRRLKQARDLAQLEEERRKAEAVQRKIRQLCKCPVGFDWIQVGGGWRCAGGSHFVSDAELEKRFTRDA